MPDQRSPQIKQRRQKWLVCLLLALGTVAVFWPVSHHDFVNYDDEDYVVKNPQVRVGLTPKAVAWAFTSARSANWHPLTWLSHMLDCQLYDLRAGGHHLTNLLFHTASAVLLCLIFFRMTGVLWRSAMVAGLFALHPLHVESVAWIAERKDVLSTFFFVMTLCAYVRYVETRKNIQHPTSNIPIEFPTAVTHYASRITSALWYASALLLFACGLMSKPMLVTLPCVLLLLDYWPLRRMEMAHVGARSSIQAGDSGAAAQRATCNLDLAIVGKLIIEKIPYFLLSLASSIITFTAQRAAMPTLDYLPLSDRLGNAAFAYVRYIGKMFWPTNLAIFYPHPGTWPTGLVVLSGLILVAITGFVLRFGWRHRYLFTGWFWFLGVLVPVIGVVQVGSQSMADRYSYVPLIGLFIISCWGVVEVWESRRLPTRHLAAVGGLLLLLCAIVTRFQLKYWQNSESLFTHALAVTTNNITAEFSLGKTYADQGRTEEALFHLQEALRLKSDFPEVHGQVAHILASQGRYDEAISHYRQAIQLKPSLTEALNNLAWLLATHPDPKFRDGAEAVRLAERACEITHYQRAIYIGTLATSYAELGRYDQAVRTAQKAHDVALDWGEKQLAARNLELMAIYQAGKPYHENYK